MAVRLSALHSGRALIPRMFSDTHVSYKLSQPQDNNEAGRIRSIEGKCNDLIVIRARDVPAYRMTVIINCGSRPHLHSAVAASLTAVFCVLLFDWPISRPVCVDLTSYFLVITF
jgi:hypothetical protein